MRFPIPVPEIEWPFLKINSLQLQIPLLKPGAMKRSLGAFRESEDLPNYLNCFSIFSLQIQWTVHVARSINRSDRYLFRGIFRNRLAALSLIGERDQCRL